MVFGRKSGRGSSGGETAVASVRHSVSGGANEASVPKKADEAAKEGELVEDGPADVDVDDFAVEVSHLGGGMVEFLSSHG